MRNDNNVIYMEEQKEGSKFKRKAEKISEIVGGSIAITLDDKNAWNAVMTVGLARGLYKWSAKSGLKTGAVTLGVLTGINIIGNLANNIKQINKA